MQQKKMKSQKFVPREKMSKKARRQLDLAGRKDWGGLSPVTRRSENPKAYNRKKVQKGWDLPPFEPSFFRDISKLAQATGLTKLFIGSCLEMIDRSDYLQNFCCRADIL